MKIFRCNQGEPEWFACRLGIPSASRFSDILTATGKPSTCAQAYRHSLIDERATGLSESVQPSEWMLRGSEMEAAARDWYSAIYNADVEQVGFVLSDHGYGCSPDGMVGDGLLEIKCPKPSTHVGYVLGGKLPTKYKPQVQGQLLVCERDWTDFVSYAPGRKPLVVRVERDEKYIKTLHDALCEFVEKLETEYQRYMEAA